jgi:predicted component of type VI protein secretion system
MNRIMASDDPVTPKLILSLEGVVLRELVLGKDRTTLGRRSHNDLVIDNLAVSGEHAVIVRQSNEAYLEDLGSTNGTVVNGQAIKRHRLSDGDTIEIGKYLLRYRLGSLGLDDPMVDLDPSYALGADSLNGNPHTMQLRTPSARSVASPDLPAGVSLVRILSGSSAGKELPLSKPLTTVGRPGRQVAVIMRRPTGFFIAHVEGDGFPLINGESVGSSAKVLRDGDLLEVAGIQMAFASGNG